MEIEVYTSAKPGVPWRAWATTSAMFLGVCALAYSMSYNRGSRVLMQSVTHEGWDLAYQIPKTFHPLHEEPQAIEPEEFAMVYRNESPSGGIAQISVHRLVVEPGTSAAKVCLHILDRQAPLLQRLMSVPHARSSPQQRPVGPREGVEMLDRVSGIVVRAVVLGGNRAYAFALRVDGVDLDPALYAYFDLTCRSVQIPPQ